MFLSRVAVLALSLLCASSVGQQIGKTQPEVHPKLKTQVCTKTGCVDKQSALVADVGSRWFHAIDSPDAPCNEPAKNKTLCPDAATCIKSCAVEGQDYTKSGVTTDGASLTLKMYRPNGDKISPRIYLLAEDEKTYEPMKLLGKEFTFDVDMSKLPCGMNSALYLSEMDMAGGRSDSSPAGATYGTGYCDAQCPIGGWNNGKPNLDGCGACCNEMDIWEANARATAYTPHPCSKPSFFTCKDAAECKAVCDKPGCNLNPYKMQKTFYGPGMTVDTNKPFKVVTQFATGTDGALTSINRFYVQGDKSIPSPKADGQPDGGLTQPFCDKAGATEFARLGGIKTMGESLGRGMVLVFSLWNSDDDFMKWLDSGDSGPCQQGEGDPKKIKASAPDSSVTFSNLRWGDIGSTYAAGTGTSTSSGPAATNTGAPDKNCKPKDKGNGYRKA